MMTIARDLILNHHYHHPSIERSFNRLIPLHTCSLPLSSLASFRVRVLYKNKILAATTSTLSLSLSLFMRTHSFSMHCPKFKCPRSNVRFVKCNHLSPYDQPHSSSSSLSAIGVFPLPPRPRISLLSVHHHSQYDGSTSTALRLDLNFMC